MTALVNGLAVGLGGAPPTGAAGGDLAGTYPNPSLAVVPIPATALTSTVPQPIGTAAAGTSTNVARVDHVHADGLFATYTVAGLPVAPGDGARAYASNGRKKTEGPGAGTGVPVYFSLGAWRDMANDTVVAT